MINKIRTYISLILIFSFLFYIINIPIYSATNFVEKHIKKGISYYDDAYFEEAVVSLEKALRYKLTKEDKIRTHLYLGLSKIALNKLDETKKHFKIIIRLNPGFSLDIDKFPPDVLKIVNDLKKNYPIISDLKIGPKEFYPYRGERPYLSFNISESDQVEIKLEAGYSTIKETEEYFSNSDKKNIYWAWSNKLISQNSLSLTLSPQKNSDEYSFKKKINLNVKMPENLRYNSGSFSLLGENFHNEYKIVEKKTFISGAWASIIIGGGLGIAFGITDLNYKYEPSDFVIRNPEYLHDDTKSIRQRSIIWFGIAAISIIWPFIFKKKTGRVKRVPIEKNIAKNKKLHQEIEQLKKNIKVKQKINEN